MSSRPIWFISALLLALPASAQDARDIRYGFTVNVSRSADDIKDEFDTRTVVAPGFIMSIPVSRQWELRPRVDFYGWTRKTHTVTGRPFQEKVTAAMVSTGADALYFVGDQPGRELFLSAGLEIHHWTVRYEHKGNLSGMPAGWDKRDQKSTRLLPTLGVGYQFTPMCGVALRVTDASHKGLVPTAIGDRKVDCDGALVQLSTSLTF